MRGVPEEYRGRTGGVRSVAEGGGGGGRKISLTPAAGTS